MSLENLPRWLTASIFKHMDDRKGDWYCYIEGQERQTNEQHDWIEIRRDGPNLTETSKDYWYVYMEINVLISSAINKEDLYRIDRMVGTVVEAMKNFIRVYKYNDGDELIGCLKLITDDKGKKRLQVNHFGQIEPKTPLLQASVEGHYEMIFETN